MQITGSLEWVTSLTKLTFVAIAGTGPLLAFTDLCFAKAFARLQSVCACHFADYGYSSSVPTGISALKNAQLLYVKGYIGGTLPSTIGALTKLQYVVCCVSAAFILGLVCA